MRIAIFGLGYVGLTSAGCLLKEGHTVLGIEPNAEKVEIIREGRSPFVEPGLDELLADGVKAGRFEVTSSPVGKIGTQDIVLVCVGTPSGANGAHNMMHIIEVSRQIAHALLRASDRKITVVYRSTLRPGSIDSLIIPIFKRVLGANFGDAVELVYSPEFLRESAAVADFFDPPKIVIGTHDGQPSARMTELNKRQTAPTFVTGFREAEFTKFVDNSWHATKISFANEIGRLCLQLGISAAAVHEIFVRDTKLNISPYYTRPGGPFGGSCLPKDVRALEVIARETETACFLIESLIRSNEAHKRFLFEHCTRGLLPGAKVLLIGLAFKPNGDDLRESPKVDLAGKLLQAQFRLSIYDPSVRPDRFMGQNLSFTHTHIPRLADILVSQEEVERSEYDLVIDSFGWAKSLALNAPNVIDINTLP